MKTKLLTCLATLFLATTALTGCSKWDPVELTDAEWEEQYGVIVPGVENIANNKNYIMGMDISSIIEVEEAGGVFYDWDGKEVDLFEFLADNGINYIRIRLWNDPYDENGNSFQGGGNDLDTDLKIARRAVDAGMKVCLDFHYSDFWADPDKQTAPREWTSQNLSLTSDGTGSLIEAAANFTTETLEAFKDAGCEPSMVQVGNEINNDVCGLTSTWSDIMLSRCCSAVRNFDKKIKIVLHLAEGANYETLSAHFARYDSGKIDYDVMGLSYYSYWHGSMETFTETINKLDKEFDHEICVMEYSYGWTDGYKEGSNQANIYSSDSEETGGYKTSVQGQASYIHDVNEAVANTKHGIGSFYWEPAWLPLNGTSWASEAAHDFLLAQNGAGGEGTTTWANQALFTFDGHPLNSLKAYKLLREGYSYEEQVVEANTTIESRINSAAEDIVGELPTITTAFTSLDRWVEYTITWEESASKLITSAANGDTVTLSGTATRGTSSFNITGIFTIYKDYLQDGGFEKVTSASDVKEAPGWTIKANSSGSYRFETKNPRSGEHNFNVWNSSEFDVDLYQTVNNLDEGTYTLEAYFRSEDGKTPVTTIYAEIGGVTYESTVDWTAGGEWVVSWPDWVYGSVTFTASAGASAKVGIHAVGNAEDWAHVDDFALYTID